MSEMVERVAKAIFAHDEHYRSANGDKWDFAPEWQRRKCHLQARSAIEAMREPTEAMIDRYMNIEPHLVDAVTIWNAMIDEALK